MLGLFGTSSDIEVSSQRVNSRLPFASLASDTRQWRGAKGRQNDHANED